MLFGCRHSGAQVLEILQVREVSTGVMRAAFDNELDLLPAAVKHVRVSAFTAF